MPKPVNINEIRQRINAKHTRASKGARVPRVRWGTELHQLSQLKGIIEWCAQRKIEVVYEAQQGSFGAWFKEEKKIEIEPRLSLAKQVIYLLHECGHVLVDSSRSYLSHIKFGDAYLKENVSTVDKTHVVAVEFEAWHRGWILAERLGLGLDKNTYDKLKSEALRSYMGWAVGSDRKL